MHAKEQRRHAAETWEATRRRQREEEKTTELGVTLAASQSSLCSSLSEEESEEEPEEKNVFAEAEGLRDEKGRLICVPSVFVSPSFSTLLRVSAYIRAHAEERDLEETEEEEAGMLVLGWREILEHRWGQCDRLTQPNLQALLQAFMPRTWFHFFQLAHLSSSSFFSSLFPAAAMAHASALSPPNPLSSAFLEERLAAFSLLRNRLYDMRHRLACCSRSLLPARSLSRLRKDRGAATPRMQEEGNDTENGAEGAEGVDAGREEDASRDASFLSREAPECLDSWKSEATRHEAEAGQQGLLSLLGEVSQLYLQLVKMIQELQVSRFGRQKWLASETPEVSPPHLSGVSEPSPSPSFSSSFSSSSSPSFSSFSSSFLPSVPARAEHRVFQKLVVLQQSVDSFLAASCCMEKWAADLVLSQRVARALERRARETASLEKRETPALSWRFGVRASVQADRKQLETTGETTRGDTPQRQTEAHPPEQTTFFSVSPAHVESQQKFIKKVVKTCVRDTQQLDRLRDALIELMYLRGEERGSEEEGPALVASSSAVASASNARAAGAEASEKEFPFSSFPLHFRDQLGLTAESAVSLLLLSFALEARRPAAVCLAFLRASAPHLLRPSLSSSSASSSSLCSASLSSCLASLLPPGYLEDPEALAVEAVRVEGEDSRREEETAEEGASTERQCGEEERGRDTRREEKHGAREREPSVGEQHWEEFLRALDDPREAPGQERTDERRVCQKETASSQIQLPFLASGSSVPGSTLESHDPAQIPGDAEGGGLSAFPTGAKGRARVRSPEEGAFSKLERLLDPTLLDPVGLKRFLGLPSSEGFTGPSGVPPLSAFVEDAFSLSSGDAAALWREVRGSATRREARQLLRSPLQTPVRDDENAREGRSRGPQKPLNPTLRLPDFSDQVSFPHTALGVGEKQRLAEKTGEKDTREKRRQLVCSSLPPVGRRLELRARQRESRRRNLEFVARGNSVFSPGDTGAVGLHAGVAARTRFQAETVREEPDRARGRNFAEEERARREREFARKSTHEALRSAYARRRELEKRAELPRDAFPEETLPEDFSEGETRRASSAGFFIEEEEAECRFGGSPEDRAGSGEVEGMSFRETFPCLRRTVEGDDEDERADEKETARMARVCHYERKDEESRRSGSALSVENRSRENKQDEGSLEADWRLRGSAAARASTPETEPTVEPERGRRRRGAVARSRSLDEETVGDTLETETEPRDRAANEKGNMRDRRLREDAHAVALQQARLSGRLEEIERRVHEKRDALRQCEEEFSSLNVPQLARFFSSSMSTAVPSQVPPAVARSVSLLRDRRRKTAKELKETEARKSELCALLAALANRKQVLNAELRRRCRQQALRQVELPEKDEKAREQRATDVLRETERNGARPRGLRRQSQGDQGSFPAKGEIGEQGEGSPDFAFALPASPERTGGNRPWFSTPSIRELTAGLFSPQNNRGMPEESEQGNPPTAREAGERGTPKESDAGDRHAGKKQETVKQRSMSRGRSSSRMGASVARDMSRESKWGECISEREGSSEKKSERGRSRQNSRARETQAQQGEKKGDSPSRSRGDNKGTEAPAPPVEAAEPCEESRGEGPRKSGGMLFSGLKSFLDLAQESPQKVLESVRQKQKGSPEEDEVMASRFASWPRRLSPSGRVRSQETQEETAVSGGECPSLAPCLHLVPRRERDDVSLCFQEELEAEMQAFEGSEEVRRPARSGGERAEGETAVEAPERSGKDESAFSPRGPREEAQKAKRIASAFSPSTVEKRLTPASGPGEAATRKDAEKVEKEKVEKEKVEKEKVEKVEEGRQEKGEKAEESRGVSWQLEKRSGAKKREQSLTRGPSAATTRASRLRALDSREKRQSLQSEQKVAEHKHVLHASPEAGRRGTKRESEKKEERGHTHTRVERKRESKATGTTDRGQTSFSSFSSSTPSSATSSSTPSSASSSSTPSSSSSSTPSSSSSSTPSSSSSSTSASSSSTSASSSSTSASCSSTSASSSSSSGLRLFDGKQEIRQRRAKVKRKGDLQSLGAHRETEASVRLPSKGESYPSFEGKQEEKRSASKETNKDLFARRDQRLRLFIRRQQEELRRLQASHAETLGASSDADLRAFSIPSVPSPSLSAEVSEILSQGPLVLQDGVVVLTEGQAALAAAREAARLLGPEGERLCKQGASEERRREGAEQRVAWEKEREQYAAGKITPEFPGNNAHLDEVREDAGGRVEATAADSGASVHRGDSRFEEWFLPRDGLLEEREELDEFDPTQTSPPLLRQSAPVRSESYGTTRCSSYVEDGKGGEREKGVSVETRRELSENGAASPAVSDVADVRLNSQFSEGDALQRETSGLGEPDRSLRGESPRDKTLASGNRTADVLTLRDCGRGTGSPRAVSRAGLCPPSARQAEKPEQCELAARLEKLETSRKELQEIRSKTSAATDTGLDGPWFGTPSSRVAVRTSLSLMLQKVEPRACGVQPLASQERRIVTPRQLGRESNSVLLAMFLDSQKMEESGADTESEERLRGASASLVAKHSTGSGTEAVGVTLAALVSSSSSGSLTTRGAAGAAGRDRGKASMQMQQKTRGVSQTARTEEGRDRDDRLSLLSLEDSGILDSPRSWTTREEESAWAGYFQQVAEERKWPTFAEGVRDGTRGDSDGPRSGGHARSTERSLCPAVDAREIREDGRGNVGEEMWRESGGDEETRFAEQAEGRKGGESVTPSFASFAAVAAERQRLRSARDKRREDLGRIEEDVRADVEIQCAVDRLVETEHTSQGRRLLREGRLRGRYATENEDCYYTVELENEF
ncbi:UNVERIFIED_CONTAM: hypothetical protein HHA_255700 [Hammondia hammondi]|eukprot:XP_008888710.1 hypothetical protein HHA_255700 [Hammondia hammondi]